MMKTHFWKKNFNLLWASVLIEELKRNGIHYFCLSPGHRSAPLASVLSERKDLKTFVAMDERGAAYHALGHAKGTGKPAALICTSGTALANYYPAFIEAYEDHLPLLVLSCDRPAELIYSNANQAIDQIKIYGRFSKFDLNLPCPSPFESLEGMITQIDQIAHLMQTAPFGPAHINCPFREPLEPKEEDILPHHFEWAQKYFLQTKPKTQYFPASSLPSPEGLNQIFLSFKRKEPGLIVVGKLSYGEAREIKETLQHIQKYLDWPIYLDIGSSLKHDFFPLEKTFPSFDFAFSQQAFAKENLRPKIILHLGGRTVSKHYYKLLEQYPDIVQIVVSEHPFKQDPSHSCSLRMISPLKSFVRELLSLLPEGKENRYEGNSPLSELLQTFHRKSQQTLKQISDGPLSHAGLVQTLIHQLPPESLLYIGNSTPIRAFDLYSLPAALSGISEASEADQVPSQKEKNSSPFIFCNRGASGIEGLIASSTGLLESLGRPVVLVLGDISFLHDLSSLTFLAQLNAPLHIILINNQSGGIFTKLPLKNYPEILYPYIATPHELQFQSLAQQFNLKYFSVSTYEELQRSLINAFDNQNHSLTEVHLTNDHDNNVDLILRKALAMEDLLS